MPSPSPFQPQLKLLNDAVLRKPGYVRVDECFVVHRDMLSLYDRSESSDHYRFDGLSYTILAERCGIESVTHSVYWFEEWEGRREEGERRIEALEKECEEKESLNQTLSDANKWVRLRCQFLEEEMKKGGRTVS